jgi:hypothetical protein
MIKRHRSRLDAAIDPRRRLIVEAVFLFGFVSVAAVLVYKALTMP